MPMMLMMTADRIEVEKTPMSDPVTGMRKETGKGNPRKRISMIDPASIILEMMGIGVTPTMAMQVEAIRVVVEITEAVQGMAALPM